VMASVSPVAPPRARSAAPPPPLSPSPSPASASAPSPKPAAPDAASFVQSLPRLLYMDTVATAAEESALVKSISGTLNPAFPMLNGHANPLLLQIAGGSPKAPWNEVWTGSGGAARAGAGGRHRRAAAQKQDASSAAATTRSVPVTGGGEGSNASKASPAPTASSPPSPSPSPSPATPSTSVPVTRVGAKDKEAGPAPPAVPRVSMSDMREAARVRDGFHRMWASGLPVPPIRPAGWLGIWPVTYPGGVGAPSLDVWASVSRGPGTGGPPGASATTTSFASDASAFSGPWPGGRRRHGRLVSSVPVSVRAGAAAALNRKIAREIAAMSRGTAGASPSGTSSDSGAGAPGGDGARGDGEDGGQGEWEWVEGVDSGAGPRRPAPVVSATASALAGLRLHGRWFYQFPTQPAAHPVQEASTKLARTALFVAGDGDDVGGEEQAHAHDHAHGHRHGVVRGQHGAQRASTRATSSSPSAFSDREDLFAVYRRYSSFVNGAPWSVAAAEARMHARGPRNLPLHSPSDGARRHGERMWMRFGRMHDAFPGVDGAGAGAGPGALNGQQAEHGGEDAHAAARKRAEDFLASIEHAIGGHAGAGGAGRGGKGGDGRK
jgi:hypothetical protein